MHMTKAVMHSCIYNARDCNQKQAACKLQAVMMFMVQGFFRCMILQAVRARFQLPLGAIAHPFAEPPGDSPLPVVQLENYGIIRCRRCRTYINPFMQWSDDGRSACTPLYMLIHDNILCNIHCFLRRNVSNPSDE